MIQSLTITNEENLKEEEEEDNYKNYGKFFEVMSYYL
jgi:hypothetical protein